jgi:hypothetical protein
MANPVMDAAVKSEAPEIAPFGPKFAAFFVPGSGQPHREDNNAARCRGGLLHFVAMWAFHWQLWSYVQRDTVDWDWFDGPFIAVATAMFVEFVIASFVGLGASPVGIIAIIITQKIQGQKPDWQPARPKRFAWFIGYFMVAICLVSTLVIEDRSIQKPILLAVTGI